MGTGNDPTSANNRNIEPWTIAGEKWELNVLSLQWGIYLYPHNHSPAYNFLQDGPMVEVTEDRLTGNPIADARPRRVRQAADAALHRRHGPGSACSRWTSTGRTSPSTSTAGATTGTATASRTSSIRWRRWRHRPSATAVPRQGRRRDRPAAGRGQRLRHRPFGDGDIDFRTFFGNMGAKGYRNPNYEQDNAPGGGAGRDSRSARGDQRREHDRAARLTSAACPPRSPSIGLERSERASTSPGEVAGRSRRPEEEP